MKIRLFLLVGLLSGLVACGGKQLVWVDVAATSEASTAVPQPVTPENDDEGVTAVPEPDSEMMMIEETAVAHSEIVLQEPAAQDEAAHSDEAALAVQLLGAVPEVADWLASYPDWTGDAWLDGDDGVHYHVDLYSAAADEWLGWGYVNVAEGAVEDYFVPRELSAEEFQVGREKVEAFVFGDQEVLARLGNVADWDFDTWYNRWDANWEVWFWYGLDELVVTVNIWEDEAYLESIRNPAEFEADQALENNKNQAIELAWQAEGIDQAVAGIDNWQTYVSQQGDTVWAVTFATEDRELFYALVDIESWTVLESSN